MDNSFLEIDGLEKVGIHVGDRLHGLVELIIFAFKEINGTIVSLPHVHGWIIDYNRLWRPRNK